MSCTNGTKAESRWKKFLDGEKIEYVLIIPFLRSHLLS